MHRKRYLWKLKEREIQLGDRTLIVGVLNVTPDSFSDGGLYNDPERALARAQEMEAQGADIIDVGAESTKPGSKRLSAEDELRRLVPVLRRLRGKLAIPISVDTYKADVATRALELGAEIINDPSGLIIDPLITKAVSQFGAGLIINHMRGTPETWAKLAAHPDPLGNTLNELRAGIHRARRTGVDAFKLIIDPGLGFGKRKEESARILANLSAFAELGHPLMTGPSRKSFLAQATPEGTLMATAAAVTASILGGAHLVRVHDVKEMVAVAAAADLIAKGFDS